MYVLDNPIKNYDWGSTTALAELMRRPSPSARPEAELWMGAHPSGSSRLVGSEGTLAQLISSNPEDTLGPQVQSRFGARLPFLMKVLAAARPLSLQAHPSSAQAVAGFLREELQGVPREALHRSYRDPFHKPELIFALSRFELLAGFRPAADIAHLFETTGAPRLLELARLLREEPGDRGIETVLRRLLTATRNDRECLLGQALAQLPEARRNAGRFSREFSQLERLAALHPGDIGAIVMLMLDRRELQPGEAVFLNARTLHAYLGGTGVEIMASSDNVLRGGLTPKHIEVNELLANLQYHPNPIEVVHPRVVSPWERSYDTPTTEFRLSRCELEGATRAELQLGGPELLLCTEGELTLEGGGLGRPGRRLLLQPGGSAFLPASARTCTVTGRGTLFRAVVPSA